jgi:hypothetical protein
VETDVEASRVVAVEAIGSSFAGKMCAFGRDGIGSRGELKEALYHNLALDVTSSIARLPQVTELLGNWLIWNLWPSYQAGARRFHADHYVSTYNLGLST